MTYPDLFAIYVGGMAKGCHVELHDMRFAIGHRIEDCTPALKAQWWGIPESLHLDAWGPLRWADGYGVGVLPAGEVPEPSAGAPRLWLCNMGGYDPAQFTELHENFFLVAPTAAEARKKAIAKVKHWTSPHKDAVLECEAVVDVAQAAETGDDWQVVLTEGAPEIPFEFEARYVPIGKMASQ